MESYYSYLLHLAACTQTFYLSDAFLQELGAIVLRFHWSLSTSLYESAVTLSSVLFLMGIFFFLGIGLCKQYCSVLVHFYWIQLRRRVAILGTRLFSLSSYSLMISPQAVLICIPTSNEWRLLTSSTWHGLFWGCREHPRGGVRHSDFVGWCFLVV